MRKVFISILFIFWFQAIMALNYEMDLFHWNVASGLPDNQVICFAQDENGFIWIGTGKGLVRFDGHEFIFFKLPKMLDNEWVSTIYKKKNELFLITNRKGYFVFNTSNFKSFKVDLKDKEKYTEKDFSFFYREEIVSKDTVSVVFNSDGKLTVGRHSMSGTFNAVFKGGGGKIWVASPDKGLGYLNNNESAITYVEDSLQVYDANLNNIVEAPDGKIWFEISTGGIGFWDGDRIISVNNIAGYSSLINGYNVFSSLIDFNITSLFFDVNGNLWIGTSGNGMFRIRLKQQVFQYFKFDYRTSNGLAHKDVSYPLVTGNGDIWIGTWGGGVNILKKNKISVHNPIYRTISPKPGVKGALQRGKVFPLLEDRRGNLWLGISDSGLQFVSRKNIDGENSFFKLYNRESGGIPGDSVWVLHEDRSGEIWVGTTCGLSRYSPGMDKFTFCFNELKDSLFFKDKDILMIYGSGKKKLWVATRHDGIYCWDRSNNQIKQYLSAGTTSLNGILCGVEMPDSSMWFGGINGLFYFDSQHDLFRSVNDSLHMPSFHIESMLSGNDNRIWLGTGKGLVAFNPLNYYTEVFRMPGGVMSNNFTQGASKDQAGNLYFGSRNGFYRFNPLDLQKKPLEIPVGITHFEIQGQGFRNDSAMFAKVLKGIDIASVDHLELPYHQNTITIGYRYLNYAPNDFKEYELLMVGLDSEWMSTFDSNRTWSNLNPGAYVFHVRVKGQEQEYILPITIASPWWTSIWAYVSFSILVFCFIMILLRYSNKRVREKEKLHQKERYDRLRFSFFLNISHEIRTPLTLIKGGIDRLIDNKTLEKECQDELQRVQRNTQRLTRMVNEVMDLKKLENTHVSVNKRDFNLKEFLEAAVDVFRLRDDHCNLVLKMPPYPVWTCSDRELIETIVYNLLSNALKYSSVQSEIRVELVCERDKNVAISVSDQGIGIKKEEQRLIFKRFYRSENQKETGTGIGLSLVKQYAELLGGTILVESELGKGSTFTLQIPDNIQTVESNRNTDSLQSQKHGDLKGKPVLILVDDQSEIRTFVREIFERDYIVFEASNGQNGWTLVKEKNPDLIISDVMMPVMNGYELCRAVRNDIRTCHIPVILLTAKTGDEAQLNAFDCQADAFINKPFNQHILRLRVDRLIELRRQLRQQFGRGPEEKPELFVSNQMDKVFIEKMEAVFNERLDDMNFNVEELASQMALSTSGLYRKIKSLTDQSPAEYMRIHRLKVAARLLKETKRSVTEIAEQTGFSTQKYFSKSFKQQFGLTPLEYRKGE
ncbi:ATP-binding protein [Saccharicrinis sp. GN24d3]|uniref:ATP-binding protein n=1 Tax=Saccharicrinis sp. GN24d3 TaxID=3458416 RepID=UPI00403504C6